MKKFAFSLLMAAAVLTGCNKEISVEHNGSNPGGGIGGGGGNGGNGQNGADTYQPMTVNSYWKYHQTGSIAGDVTLTATDQTQNVNGLFYHVFNGTGTYGNSQSLYSIKDHNYYVLYAGTSPNTGASFNINFLYLNDTASVGYTWTNSAGQGGGIAAYTPGKVLEKGISLTVAGKTYNDVIHTQVELQYDMPGFGSLTFITYDYFVAKNIGVIRILSVGDPLYGAGINTTTDLVDYSIK